MSTTKLEKGTRNWLLFTSYNGEKTTLPQSKCSPESKDNIIKTVGGKGDKLHTNTTNDGSTENRNQSFLQKFRLRIPGRDRGPIRQEWDGANWYYVDQDGNRVEKP